MKNGFDELSKKVAGAISRREAIGYIFSAFIGSTLASKVFGQSRAVVDTCPSCGTCRTCNSDTGDCQPTCANSCLAAILCQEAQNNAEFTSVREYLIIQGFRQIGEANALVTTGTALQPAQIIEIKYIKRLVRTISKPRLFDETASLIFYKPVQGNPTAKAIVMKNSHVNYVLFSSQNGVRRFYRPTFRDYPEVFYPSPQPPSAQIQTTAATSSVTSLGKETYSADTYKATGNSFSTKSVPAFSCGCGMQCALSADGALGLALAAACLGASAGLLGVACMAGGIGTLANIGICVADCKSRCEQREACLELNLATCGGALQCYDPNAGNAGTCCEGSGSALTGFSYLCNRTADGRNWFCFERGQGRYCQPPDYPGICVNDAVSIVWFCPNGTQWCGTNVGICCFGPNNCQRGFP